MGVRIIDEVGVDVPTVTLFEQNSGRGAAVSSDRREIALKNNVVKVQTQLKSALNNPRNEKTATQAGTVVFDTDKRPMVELNIHDGPNAKYRSILALINDKEAKDGGIVMINVVLNTAPGQHYRSYNYNLMPNGEIQEFPSKRVLGVEEGNGILGIARTILNKMNDQKVKTKENFRNYIDM